MKGAIGDAVSKALEDSWIDVEPGDSDLDILVKIEKVLREIDLDQ
jgi:hypothetical protein